MRRLLNKFETWCCKYKLKSFGKGSSICYPATLNHPELITIGKNVSIRENAWLNCVGTTPSLSIGDNSYLGRFIHINAYSSVVIEENVLISDRVFISDVHHAYQNPDIPIMNQGVTTPSPVLLKKGCWIGGGAVIMPGVTIGHNAVVAANAVVTHDVPDRMIARGVPANNFEMNIEKDNK